MKDNFVVLWVKVKGELKLVHGTEKSCRAKAKLEFRKYTELKMRGVK